MIAEVCAGPIISSWSFVQDLISCFGAFRWVPDLEFGIFGFLAVVLVIRVNPAVPGTVCTSSTGIPLLSIVLLGNLAGGETAVRLDAKDASGTSSVTCLGERRRW